MTSSSNTNMLPEVLNRIYDSFGSLVRATSLLPPPKRYDAEILQRLIEDRAFCEKVVEEEGPEAVIDGLTHVRDASFSLQSGALSDSSPKWPLGSRRGSGGVPQSGARLSSSTRPGHRG